MNQRRAVIWVSLGAPLLILFALLAINQRQGKDRVSIPIPRIDIPRFRFDDQKQGGVGQGGVVEELAGEVELGYQIVAAHRRRGLTAEGCAALVTWAFHNSATTAVIADCGEENTASIRTLQKLGFTHERSARERHYWRLPRPV